MLGEAGLDNERISRALVEMQSAVDHLMPFWLLGYLVRIWERYVKDAGVAARRKNFRLPPILPVVLYDGEWSWTALRSFREKVLGGESLGECVPEFRYDLFDLGRVPAESFVALERALSVFLYADHPRNVASGDEMVRVALRMAKMLPEGEERNAFFRHVRLFVTMAWEKEPSEEELEELTGKEAIEMFATLCKKLRGERRRERMKSEARGEARGELRKSRQIARAMLAEGLSDAVIARAAGLSPEEIERLRE